MNWFNWFPPNTAQCFKSKLTISLYHHKWYRLHSCLKIWGKVSNSSQSKTLEFNIGFPNAAICNWEHHAKCEILSPEKSTSELFFISMAPGFSHPSLKPLTPSAKLGQWSAAVHVLGQVLRETVLVRLICCPHDSDYLWPLTWRKTTLGDSRKCSPWWFLWTCSARIFHVGSTFQACTGSGNWNKRFSLCCLFSLCVMETTNYLGDP